jgi:hypothetical protein
VPNLLGEGLPGWLTYMIAFAGVTYLSVVVGELMPKALTLDRAETMAVLVARPIELIAVGAVLRLKPTDFAGIFVASGADHALPGLPDFARVFAALRPTVGPVGLLVALGYLMAAVVVQATKLAGPNGRRVSRGGLEHRCAASPYRGFESPSAS